MDTACYQYSLGMPLDMKKLEKLPQIKRIGKLEAGEAHFGELVVHIFKTGEMRAFLPEQGLDRLQPALLSSGIKIIELLTAIKKLGYEIDEQKVLSSGHPMPFEYLAPDGVRPSFDGVSVNVLREMAYAPYDLAQEFQLERNEVQAGENAGRRLVERNAPKSVEGVNKLLAGYLEGNGIGVPSFAAEKGDRTTYPVQVLTLGESAFAAGMPVINKPYCHFVRGLLRGAYVSFYELENIEVKETACWGLGDSQCVFKARIYPK